MKIKIKKLLDALLNQSEDPKAFLKSIDEWADKNCDRLRITPQSVFPEVDVKGFLEGCGQELTNVDFKKVQKNVDKEIGKIFGVIQKEPTCPDCNRLISQCNCALVHYQKSE